MAIIKISEPGQILIQVPKPNPEVEAEIEEIDLSDLEDELEEFYEEGDRSDPPSLDDLGVFETYEGIEYTPFDQDGEFISPESELDDAECEVLYDELLLDREDEQRYQLLERVEPQPEEFKCYSDYENAKWGYDSTTYMSGNEQAFSIYSQMFPIDYINGRWVFPSTSGKRTVHYDIRWGVACKKSFADLPQVTVYTANQLSDVAGVSTKTLKKMMKYALNTPFVRISDRYFMTMDDYKTLAEHHPEVFTMIKDHPLKGPEYISSLVTFDSKGKYPNKRELMKFVGQNGFETLVKYKVLKSMQTLGHRFGYYYYRTPERSWFKIWEDIMELFL